MDKQPDVKIKALQQSGESHDPQFLDLVYGGGIVDDSAPIEEWVDMSGPDIPFCTLVQHWGRIVQADGLLLEHAPENYKADDNIVLKAVHQNGLALQIADESLHSNRNIAFTAAQQNGLALQFVADGLRFDLEVVMAAVQQDGMALEFAALGLRANFAIVEAAVQQNGMALEFASDALRQEVEIVASAVRQNGMALEFAWPALRSNVAILRAAVQQNGMVGKRSRSPQPSTPAPTLVSTLNSFYQGEGVSYSEFVNKVLLFWGCKLLQHTGC